MGEPIGVQSDEYYKFADAIYNSTQLMRQHGQNEPLVVVVGSGIETFGRSFIVNDFGVINIYRAANLDMYTMHTITQSKFEQDLMRGIYLLIQ